MNIYVYICICVKEGKTVPVMGMNGFDSKKENSKVYRRIGERSDPARTFRKGTLHMCCSRESAC